MGDWSYTHSSKQTAGCQDEPGVTLYLGSCDGRSLHVVVRTEVHQMWHDDKCSIWSAAQCTCPGSRIKEKIASIHVPNERVPDFVWAAIIHSGVRLADVLERLDEGLEIEEAEAALLGRIKEAAVCPVSEEEIRADERRRVVDEIEAEAFRLRGEPYRMGEVPGINYINGFEDAANLIDKKTVQK